MTDINPRELAARIAADIREHGFYPGTGTSALLWDPDDEPAGKCCLLFNPTLRDISNAWLEAEGDKDSSDYVGMPKEVFEDAFAAHLGLPTNRAMTEDEQRRAGMIGYSYFTIIGWNDIHGEEQVLAELDAMAAGKPAVTVVT